MASVTLRKLTKKFNTVVAVNSLDLEIQDKEFLVLVGPSGCGKTTALRMIAGLEEATSGEILVGDRVVNDVPPKDRDMAMVFQNYALYPHMSVYDNMAFALRMRKIPREEIKQRVQEAAALLGLDGLLERKPKQLSGGQRQRVALGRAIVRNPQVFLMDEPLSNLDAKLRVQTRAELIKLQRRLAVTTIYVTHDQVEAMTMGDRIAVMRDGLLQQVDTPINIYNHPANVFVAGFIGTPPMNFVEVTLEQQGDTIAAVAGQLKLPFPAERSVILKPMAGRKAILGIRPEHIMAPADATPGAAPFDAVVDVVELMGSTVTAYLAAYGVNLIATLDATADLKETVSHPFVADMGRAHIFDAETEKAVF